VATQAEAQRQIVREGFSYVRRIGRVSRVRVDGVEIGVDYRRWSPKLVRRVLAERYEVEERKLIPALLTPEDRVLEIGGGVGLIAMLCARIVGDGAVFVYEANPDILQEASENFRRNGRDIAIMHAAVVGASHHGDDVTFFVSDDFWSSSLLDRGKTGRAIVAPAVRLDELIEKHSPSVIIADVEGAEHDILLGSDLSSIQKLCIECHTRYIGVRKVSDLVRSLLDRGFLLQLERSIGEVLYFSRQEG
jgi:FkbM family methyltransferase